MTSQPTAQPLFSLFGGTIPGPPSKKRGKPNQDYFGSAVNDVGSAVIVATDGAGSLEKSEVGARLTVETILDQAVSLSETEYSPDAILELAVEQARQQLLAHPDKSELGCTVAAAFVSAHDYAISITGDAFAVVLGEDDDIALIENEQQGEYANITKLLTSKSTDTAVYYAEGSPQAVAVSSDGLAHFTIDSRTRVPTDGFWRPVLNKALDGSLGVESLLRYMESLGQTDDDTTLTVAARNRESS